MIFVISESKKILKKTRRQSKIQNPASLFLQKALLEGVGSI